MQLIGREFQIIQRYFQQYAQHDESVSLSIGDDCALINPSVNMQQAISVDTSIADRHFPSDANPYYIGRRALNVSVSDLAAMGATPRWFTLAISLPAFDEAWLAEFSRGLFEAAKEANIQLIGGDTTKAQQLSITIQVHGEVAFGMALKRSGAKVGNNIYVTGVLGSAAAGLKQYQQGLRAGVLLNAYLNPTPKLLEGAALLGHATSCIDISDGLLADLSHILSASNCGAEIDLAAIPLAAENIASFGHTAALNFALNGGDDYQLCFTSKLSLAEIERLGVKAHCIGQIIKEQGMRVINPIDGVDTHIRGFDHFHDTAI